MEENKKGFFAEFKEFITKGNVIDLAVGVIIGGAFTAIVNALVNYILMPIIGLVSPDGFTGLYAAFLDSGKVYEADTTLVNGAVAAAGTPIYRCYIYYGLFIQAVINFILIAFVLFLIVRTINRVRRKADAAKEKAKLEINKARAEKATEEVAKDLEKKD